MSDLKTVEDAPDVSPDEWELTLSGAVETPVSLAYEKLTSYDLVTVTDDFECLEGWVAEDLTWRGVWVDKLLERAGPTVEEGYGLVRAIDGGYACSFELGRLGAGLLAVELDGEPLPAEHGGPVRLVFPDGDSDCWESIKWVREISVRESPPVEADTAEGIARSRIE